MLPSEVAEKLAEDTTKWLYSQTNLTLAKLTVNLFLVEWLLENKCVILEQK